MLNLRTIDKNFALSGGWNDLEKNIEELKQLRVTHVLDLQFTDLHDPQSIGYIRSGVEEAGLVYQNILMFDGMNTNLESIFEAGGRILDDWEDTIGKDRILVKCAAGISRSPSMLTHHICETRRLTFDEAINFIRQQERYQVEFPASPNTVFWTYLQKKFGGTAKSAFGDIIR